jgi:hypothetical protein
MSQSTGAAASPAQQYAQAVAQNAQARQAVLQYGLKRTQQIYSTTVNPANTQVLNIPPQNVGLIQGFLVEVNTTFEATTHNGALTEYGSSNVLSNIQFSDLSNYIRHNTSGRHLSIINSAKQGFVFGAAYQPNVPQDWSAYNTGTPAEGAAVVPNWNVRSAPTVATAGTPVSIREFYYVPIAYSATDTRGAIYAAVTNATMNLQLTINANPLAVGTTDPTNAVYSAATGASGGFGTGFTVTVYQIYWDQLPTVTQSGVSTVVLPLMDLNQQYCLLETTIAGITEGSDFPYAYANYRNYYSTVVTADNGGVLNFGSDINYVALTSANNTNIFKYTPEVAALQARQTFMADPPGGLYYFDSRTSPINSNQFGNVNLNFNYSSVNANAKEYVGAEYFATQNQVATAQSLQAS